MYNKICKICQIEKPIDEFPYLSNQNIYRSWCKQCNNLKAKERYYKNKNPNKINRTIHTQEEKELAKKLREAGKSFDYISKEMNISKTLIVVWCNPEYKKRCLEANKINNKKLYENIEYRIKKSEYAKQRRKNNYEHVMEIHRKSKEKNRQNRKLVNKQRRHIDIPYKLIEQQRGYIKKKLKTQGIKKSSRTNNLLGCDGKFLKEYLEKQFKDGMNWDNHSQFGWHVDHIKPLNTFDLNDTNQQKEAFHYTNLRPLWWHENLSRNKKFDLENTK